jgi:hypothetical protein
MNSIKIPGLTNGSFKHPNFQKNNGSRSPLTAAVSVMVAMSDLKYLRNRRILVAKTRNLNRARNIKERNTQGIEDHSFAEKQAF